MKIKNEGTRLLRRGFYKEAVSNLQTALSGLRDLQLKTTDPCVVEAAWGLADAYMRNPQRENVQEMYGVLKDLSAIYFGEMDLWDSKSVLHYIRIAETFQIYGRHEAARTLGLQLYMISRQRPALVNWKPITSGDRGVEEPEGLGKDLLDRVFYDSTRETKIRQQLRLGKLWCTTGLAGMDYVLKHLRVVECSPDRERDYKYLSLRLKISRQEGNAVMAECKAARDSMAERILDHRMTQLQDLLRQCRELAKLHLLNNDMDGYYIALNWTADNLEKVILDASSNECKKENVRLLIDHFAQTGINCYQNPGWGWSKARIWFERAYILATTKLGTNDERSLELECELDLECYVRERSLF